MTKRTNKTNKTNNAAASTTTPVVQVTPVAPATNDKTKQREIDALITALKSEIDANKKKSIRRALRQRGHVGGLNERRSHVASIIASIKTSPAKSTTAA